MKKYVNLLLFVPLFLMLGCAKEAEEKDADANGGKGTSTQSGDEMTAARASSEIMGTYTGMFGKNKITIAIQELAADGKAKGYSVVSGNERPFKGSYEKKEDGYILKVSEPGDDPYDGTFEFVVFPATQKLTGKWTPNNTKLELKNYTLDKRTFQYKTDVGQYPEASQRLINEDEVLHMIKSELRMMRNEMYARHGYCFKMKDMRAFFDTQDWYMPVSTDVRNQLTEIEKKNEKMIQRYEKYAAEYYDSFGR